MNRDQFLRALRRYCRANGLEAPRFVARRGKGGHGRIFIGEVFTTIPSGELKAPTREGILRQLGLPKDSIKPPMKSGRSARPYRRSQTMRPLTYYAYIHEAAPGDWLVRFCDIPEAITQGDSLEEAVANASDCLEAALEGYIELGRAFPARADLQPHEATPGACIVEVAVAPALAARALLADAMQAQRLSKVALAQRMGRDEKVIRRILSGKGASLDLTLQALRAVGIRAALAA